MLSDIWSAASAGILLQKILTMSLGLIGIGLIIAIHECGHFIFAKLFKVNVPSFSIGFGPKIFSKSLGTTQFSLSLIPVGGYVEAESGRYDNPTPGSIAALPYWKKLTIIAGGILFNLIFSYLIFSFLFFKGLPQNPFIASTKPFFVASTEINSPAAQAGIQPNDVIISIDNKPLDNNLPTLLDYIQKHPKTQVSVTIQRNGSLHTLPVLLGSRHEGNKEIGTIGVQFSFAKSNPLPLLKSFKESWLLTTQIFTNSFKAFTRSIRKKETKQFAGPLMIIKVAGQSAAEGLNFFLFLLAYISIGIAVMNIIPLPIFDGGQALTYTLESLFRRAIPDRILNYIHLSSWLLMVGLFILLTYQDLLNFFK